ncbi:MAG: ATP-binding protein [Bryobacteraceae bacterium]
MLKKLGVKGDAAEVAVSILFTGGSPAMGSFVSQFPKKSRKTGTGLSMPPEELANSSSVWWQAAVPFALFSRSYMPHGSCFLWQPGLIALHVTSDSMIALAYFLIPAALVYLVRKRRDLVFNWIFWMFAAFILLCGTTHVMNIVTLWKPYYPLEGIIKLVTGVVSIITAVVLVPLIPRVLALPKPEELAIANRALAEQIAVTRRAEDELRKLNTELERRVTERTAALKRSNDDLAQFAYIASHDLQEPVRMVMNFTALLRRRYTNQLDAEAMTYITFAADGAARMHDLVSGMLSYAQLETPESDLLAPVDSRQALEEALDVLRMPIAEVKAEVIARELPLVRADKRQLGQIFQNLIANAIKYRRASPPRIEIWTESVNATGLVRFFVKDNGTGFDMRYKNRLFTMFQRLDNGQAGTGMGLAICKKIVQRHGGTIDVESTPGEGTTFSFTLPATVDMSHFI